MDFSVCTQCGVEIESKGIHFRNHVFCCDECCEDFDKELASKGGPVIDELVDDDLDPVELDEDLDYSEDDDVDPLDDDFDLKVEDF